MDPVDALIALVRAHPDDKATRLVLADLLCERGDSRGELLLIEDALERGGVDIQQRRIQLQRYLTLLAEHGLEWLEGDDGVLPFEGGGSHPVQYDLEFAGHHYYVRYRHGGFSIDVDYEGVLELEFASLHSDYPEDDWTSEETNVYLGAVSDAIRAGSFNGFYLPSGDELTTHPRFRLGVVPRGVLPDCFLDHRHDYEACYRRKWSIAARYGARWSRALSAYLKITSA